MGRQSRPDTPPDSTNDEAPVVDRALLEKWALSYLERYASSAENLRRVLLRRVHRRFKGESARAASEPIDALLVRYRAAGLLDDAAYAAGRVRGALAKGRSLRRIGADLAAKGIGDDDAAAALAALRETSGDPDLAAACAFARRRRLGPYRRTPAAEGDRQRELGAFARAGFDRRTAQAILACADEAEITALLAEAAPE
jgi:regulatory protein